MKREVTYERYSFEDRQHARVLDHLILKMKLFDQSSSLLFLLLLLSFVYLGGL